ncbi:hypothetical protein [Streptomyces griseus]|uniref:hypothetical protein n=1 Tax=Streptomyces griseus TaxID=1911 RepID=UPI0033D938C0
MSEDRRGKNCMQGDGNSCAEPPVLHLQWTVLGEIREGFSCVEHGGFNAFLAAHDVANYSVTGRE